MQSQGDLIAPLKAELDLLASRMPVRAENQAAIASKGHAVTIMGDKAIPYQLLRKVMATAARANYSDVSFAVVEKVKGMNAAARLFPHAVPCVGPRTGR